MSLIRLHPASFRERWGPELEADAHAAGHRSWSNLLVSAIDMWLHPVVWPAESASQRHHRAAAMALAVTLGAIQVGRIVGTISTSVVTPPSPARLRLGIVILAVGGALASWISLSSVMAGGGFDGVSAAAGGCLLILTGMLISLLRDLSHC